MCSVLFATLPKFLCLFILLHMTYNGDLSLYSVRLGPLVKPSSVCLSSKSQHKDSDKLPVKQWIHQPWVRDSSLAQSTIAQRWASMGHNTFACKEYSLPLEFWNPSEHQHHNPDIWYYLTMCSHGLAHSPFIPMSFLYCRWLKVTFPRPPWRETLDIN